jgi:hypothetical protein
MLPGVLLLLLLLLHLLWLLRLLLRATTMPLICASQFGAVARGWRERRLLLLPSARG